MYHFEPVLALVCMSSAFLLLIAWRVLNGTADSDSSGSPRPFLRQALASTGNYIIPAEVRECCIEEKTTQVHEFRDVHCSYHGDDDFDVQWSEEDETPIH